MQRRTRAWVAGLALVLAGWVLGESMGHARGGGRQSAPKAKKTPADVDAASEHSGPGALAAVSRLELSRAPSAAVVPYLQSADAPVRARAALALGRLQEWTAVAALVPMLSDPDPNVRRTAAFSLGQMDPVMPLLLDQIKAGAKGADPRVKGPAMARVAAEKKVDARLHLEERPEVRRALYTALGPLAVAAGLHHLQFGVESGPAEAAWAARALGVHGHRRGKDAVTDPAILDKLLGLLTAQDADVRYAATYALFRLHAGTPAALADRLGTDRDTRVRVHAARALAGSAAGADALVVSLRDPDWRVRVEAMRALALAPQPRGLSSKEDMAAVAVAAKDATGVLLSSQGLTQAPQAHVAITGAGVLSRAAPVLAQPHLNALAAQLGVLPSAGDAAPAPVRTRRPVGEWWQVRCAVALALDTLSGNPQRVASCGLPGEPEWWKNARAVEVVVDAPGGDSDKLRRLGAFLADRSPHVRLAAAERVGALDPVKAPDAAAVLVERLASEKDPGVLGALADALRTRSPAAHAAALAAALKRLPPRSGEHADAAAMLLEALAAAGQASTAPAIRPYLSSPWARLRRGAQVALAATGTAAPAAEPVDPPLQPQAADNLPARAYLQTSRGPITLRFYRQDAPLTVTSFAALAQKGFFKGLTFHRVVADFVIQGGDPRGDGSGGPGYALPCEYSARPYERGVVGMALSGKDSGGSQFFITQGPQPHLDGRYTAFAEVEAGMDVVDAILAGDKILDVTVK